jgi:hypothetical protein
MRIKTFKQYFEDATANATTAGMGAVTSSQPGALPGTTGVEGSGDVGFTFTKEKRKRGPVDEVSDLRDLEDDATIGDKFAVVNIKEKIKHSVNHLKRFNESNVIITDQMSPIIGYQKDIESNNTSLMDGYYTGTVYIGDESDERESDVDYSSPFHTGQVMGDGLNDVDEMDFSYSRSVPSDKVEQLLKDHVSKNYNGKIVKIVYH